MPDWLNKHGWTIFNSYIFFNILGWTLYQGYNYWGSQTLGISEVIFSLHNLVLCGVILLRTKHRRINKNIFEQFVALIAFFSGVAFIGQPHTASPEVTIVADLLMVGVNLLGIGVLLNIGNAFGILIAYREVRTSGFYSVIRHPMYLTDILIRIVFLLSHCTVMVFVLTILSSACYVYRALLEERFLSREQSYRDYMERVRYRLIPHVF